jgi:hypothetical protein
MLRSHGDSGIYDGIQADVHQLTVRANASLFLPDLAVRREQQVVLRPCVHRQARHYEFDVDRHVVHTDQKFKSTGNINIFSRHGRKLFHVRPSCRKEQSKKQDHQVSTTEGMIDMMTVVRDMTPTKTFLRAVLTPLPTVSIHEHRRIEYRDAITVQYW